MKKMLLSMALLCLISIAAKAQYTTIGLKNYTGCTVYMQFYGSTTASCSVTQISGLIVVPPGTLSFPDPSAVPGWSLTASDYITGVRVFYVYTPCRPLPTSYVDMSDCPSIGVASAPSSPIVNAACLPACASASGTIDFTAVSTTTASLTVNP